MAYYYREESDTYHCKENCTYNTYPKAGWRKSSTPPVNKKPCTRCKADTIPKEPVSRSRTISYW